MRLKPSFDSDTAGTRARILDVAEGLFAERGFHATTLRDITQLAQANVAAVNYHFGSKEALIEAVFERRLDALNTERLNALEVACSGSTKPHGRLEDVLEAFILPAIALTHSPHGAGHRFMQLLMRAFAEPDHAVHAAMRAKYAPVMQRFARALQAHLPHHSPQRIRQHLDFLTGALTFTMAEADLSNPRATARALVEFTAAGLQGAPARTDMEIAS
jgi:AcrR family transcriptional regulator